MYGNWLVLTTLVLSTARCSLQYDDLEAFGQLVMAHVVFRNGAKAPVDTFPLDPFTEDQWGVKRGELTQLGKEEQYNLGVFLRSRYDGFIPTIYSPDDVYVRTSDLNNIMDSAAMVMDGMFRPYKEPGEYVNVFRQQVPIYTESVKNNLLVTSQYPPCPAYPAEMAKVNSSIEYQRFKSQLGYVDDFSKNLSGLDPNALYFNLYAKDYHGQPLPSWSQRLYPEPLTSYVSQVRFFRSASTVISRRMYVGQLVRQILENMRMKIEGTLTPDRKLFAYGDEASILLTLLSAMNVWDGEITRFSACLLVELRRNQHNQHVVTVSYKKYASQTPQLLHLPRCRTAACSFQEFMAALAPEVFNEAECYGESTVLHTPVVNDPDNRECQVFSLPYTP